jgi:serine/threonine protein phosphatase PrpC
MWKTGYVSVQGIAHIKSGQINQDLVICETLGEATVIIVCDGAGSASHSRLGAEIVSGEILQAISGNSVDIIEAPAVNEDILLSSVKLGIRSAREKIIQGKTMPQTSLQLTFRGIAEAFAKKFSTKIKSPPPPLSQFASTVLIAVFTDNQLFHSHIGDGFICGLKQDQLSNEDLKDNDKISSEQTSEKTVKPEVSLSQIVTSLPENGEYKNQTYFFTDESWEAHIRSGKCDEPLNLLFLMTDGAGEFLIQKNQEDFVLQHAEKITAVSKSHPDMSVSELLSKMFPPEKVHTVTSDDTSIGLAIKCH